MKHKTPNPPQNYNLRSQSELAQSTSSESTHPQDGATSEPHENLPQTLATPGTESVPSELHIIPEDTHQTSTDSETLQDSTDTGVAQAIPINPVPTPPPEQNRRNMTSSISLSKFTGSESPHIWLSKLAAWQKFNKLTDNDVLYYVPCLLEGSAGTWFQTLSPTQYTTLKDFQDSLKDRFKPNCYSGMATLKQEPGESTELNV